MVMTNEPIPTGLPHGLSYFSGRPIITGKEIRTGRTAIGIELDEKSCGVAAKRCSQGVVDFVGAA